MKVKNWLKKLWKFVISIFRKNKRVEVKPTGTTSIFNSYYSATEPYFQHFTEYKKRNQLK